MTSKSRNVLRYMAILKVVVVIASLGFSRRTEAYEDLHRLLSARSSSEFARRLNGQRREKKEGLICDVQLKTGKLPIACFALLHDESERLNWSGFHGSTNVDWQEGWLDTLCANRASHSLDRQELKKAVADFSLPAKCRKAAEARAADLNYIDQSERPALLFRMRDSDGFN